MPGWLTGGAPAPERRDRQLQEQHHLRERQSFGVGNGEQRAICFQSRESSRGAAVKLQLRGRPWRTDDLDIAPMHTLSVSCAERLHGRFFCREPSSEMRCRIAPPRGVSDFAVGKDAAQEPITVARDGRFDAIDFGGIEADADNICSHAFTTA